MGNIFTSFFSRRQKMSPDRALEILYDALCTQSPASIEGDGAAPAVPGPTFAEWCRRLGLPRQKLDRYLRKELGCSGKEWVHTIYSSGLDKKKG